MIPHMSYSDDYDRALREWQIKYARQLITDARWARECGSYALAAYCLREAAEMRLAALHG